MENNDNDHRYHQEGGNPPKHSEVEQPSIDHKIIDAYWKANLRLLAVLLSIWALVSFGCSVLFVDTLNQITFFGFPLGFWFAQQGSIICFVLLIFVYSHLMGKMEDRFNVDDDEVA